MLKTEIITYFSGITKCIKAQDPDMMKYFKFSTTEKEIQIKTKKELENLDKDLDPQPNIVFNGYISCYLACPDGETIIVSSVFPTKVGWSIIKIVSSDFFLSEKPLFGLEERIKNRHNELLFFYVDNTLSNFTTLDLLLEIET